LLAALQTLNETLIVSNESDNCEKHTPRIAADERGRFLLFPLGDNVESEVVTFILEKNDAEVAAFACFCDVVAIVLSRGFRFVRFICGEEPLPVIGS
jgi:hypothetical protein